MRERERGGSERERRGRERGEREERVRGNGERGKGGGSEIERRGEREGRKERDRGGIGERTVLKYCIVEVLTKIKTIIQICNLVISKLAFNAIGSCECR